MINIIKLEQIIHDLSKAAGSEEAMEKVAAFQAYLIKGAQEEELVDVEPKEVDLNTEPLLNFMACLRLNLVFIQTAHWISKGKSAFGDHLLYERIYNNLVEEIDKYGERIIGLAGEETVDPMKVMEIATNRLPQYAEFSPGMDGKEIAENALRTEKYVLSELEKLYEGIKEADKMTMGMDDLLMGMHSMHQEHVYLIQQRLKEE